MKTLKELAEDIKVDFVRVGFDPETEQTKFIAIINHQNFEYSCGLRACIPEKTGNVPGFRDPLKNLARQYRIRQNDEEQTLQLILQGRIKAIKNVKDERTMSVFYAISNLCKPTAYDVLYCLRLDSEADNMSFNDWCDMCGYDNDSISALKIYHACQENARKLRLALGHELYNEIMQSQDE